MEDPLTQPGPPSRSDPDELDIFSAAADTALSPPSILWSPSISRETLKIETDVLVVALSRPGKQFVNHLPGSELVGSVIQAGLSMAGNTLGGGIDEKACYIYSARRCLLVSVQYSIPTEHATIWAGTLLESLTYRRVIILGSVSRENFRGPLSADEERIFLLKTDQQKFEDGNQAQPAPYFPSGSLIEGLSAALLTYCQVRGIPGRLLATWPEYYSVQRLAEVIVPLIAPGLAKSTGWSSSDWELKGQPPLHQLYV